MLAHDVLDVAQPVVDQPQAVAEQRRLHAAAAVVAAHDDVLDAQHIHRELHDRQAVEVRMDHHVGDVAMHEHFARLQAGDLVGRHAAVGTAYPQVFRGLQTGKLVEEIGILRRGARGPGAIGLQKMVELWHDEREARNLLAGNDSNYNGHNNERRPSMLITFKSKAAGDVIMFGDVARDMMKIMGKEPGEQGIVTVEQLPQAIARLREAIDADKAREAQVGEDEQPKFEKTPAGGKREYVSLYRRAAPLLELLEYSLKERAPVVWGT